MGRGCIFRRVVSEGLIEKLTFEQRLEEKQIMWIPGEDGLRQEVASAKALRQGHVWCIGRTVRKPERLEWSECGSRGRRWWSWWAKAYMALRTIVSL